MRFIKGESEINLVTSETEVEFSEWKLPRPEEVIEQVFFRGN